MAGDSQGVAAAGEEFLQRRAHGDKKVTTPSRKEVQGTTTVVIITVFIFAGYFWVIDSIIGKTLEKLLHTLAHR